MIPTPAMTMVNLDPQSAAPPPGAINKELNARHLVILVHGFNTYASWMHDVEYVLRKHGFHPAKTYYGYLGPVRLLTFPFLRNSAKDRLREQIVAAILSFTRRNGYVPDKVSVIAHSFGAWVLTEVLREDPYLKLHRVILCGGLLREDYDFIEIRDQFNHPILNHVGTRDPWPAIGARAGWGFGRIRARGLISPYVLNCWHENFAHSDFLSPSFFKHYCIPFLEGKSLPIADKPQNPPVWVRAVSVLPIRWFLLALPLVVGRLIWRPSSRSMKKASEQEAP
jgi:pimeloyl-ACP methyl ester carboxylesterase